MKRELDELIKQFFLENPTYLDLNDPTIIAYDKDGIGYSAKDLNILDEKLKKAPS